METSLVLDVKPGDVLAIDAGKIKIELVHKSGRAARLRFVAPAETDINLIKPGEGLKELKP